MSDGKHNVMVVDDDLSVRESLHKLLETDGYRVILASNGAEALEIFRQKQCEIDLLLVDLNLPIKNGWVTVNQALELNPGLPVFIITALSHQKELAEAAGVSALIEKPIDVPELLRLIQDRLADAFHGEAPRTRRHEFSFHHVQAIRYKSDSVGTGENVTPHSHWGLNE